jgi:hypothetical protein
VSAETIISLAPASDGPWFALCPDGTHRRVVAWQLVRVTDDSGDEAPEVYETVQGVVPRFAAGIEGVAPVDDCHHADELPCVAHGVCSGHDAAETADEPGDAPVDLRRVRRERAESA